MNFLINPGEMLLGTRLVGELPPEVSSLERDPHILLPALQAKCS